MDAKALTALDQWIDALPQSGMDSSCSHDTTSDADTLDTRATFVTDLASVEVPRGLSSGLDQFSETGLESMAVLLDGLASGTAYVSGLGGVVEEEDTRVHSAVQWSDVSATEQFGLYLDGMASVVSGNTPPHQQGDLTSLQSGSMASSSMGVPVQKPASADLWALWPLVYLPSSLMLHLSMGLRVVVWPREVSYQEYGLE